MLNAFSDVASAPTDLTARTVALTRVDETASRMRAASQALDDLQQARTKSCAKKSVPSTPGARHCRERPDRTHARHRSAPNDLLDRRDQLVRELNQYVQPPPSRPTMARWVSFWRAARPWCCTTVSPVSIVSDDFGDSLKNKLAMTRNGLTVVLDENALVRRRGGWLATLSEQ